MAAVVGALSPLAACAGAPQIVAFAPDRGASAVPTSRAIEIDFDRPVDESSVAARFSVEPGAAGRITWPSDRRLVFVHPPLRTDTDYRVWLRAGYRSASGGASDLDHTWTFHTEGPLQVTGWAPGPGDLDVDPAAYLAVVFNHPLAATQSDLAFSISPAMPFAVQVDPGDHSRALIAPQGLLRPDQTYVLTAAGVHDQDGNPLPRPVATTFQTGPVRPLHGWVSYLEVPPSSATGTPGSLWIVDANRLPRQLVPSPVLAYNWAPAADELTLETGARTWVDLPLGGTATPLGIAADWAAPLGAPRGFAYLDGNTLGILTPSGGRTVLAQQVTAAAVSRDGSAIAYTVAEGDSTQVWAATVELRSRYLVGTEAGTVLGLTWSPDGQRLAYELIAGGASRIRVRTLTQSSAVTAATGLASDPAWDADSAHLFVLAVGGSPARPRIYRIPIGGPPVTLGGGAGMPAAGGPDAGPPRAGPDGHQVVFLGATGRDQSLWVMNADGTGLALLAGGPGAGYSCRDPSWTPA